MVSFFRGLKDSDCLSALWCNNSTARNGSLLSETRITCVGWHLCTGALSSLRNMIASKSKWNLKWLRVQNRFSLWCQGNLMRTSVHNTSSKNTCTRLLLQVGRKRKKAFCLSRVGWHSLVQLIFSRMLFQEEHPSAWQLWELQETTSCRSRRVQPLLTSRLSYISLKVRHSGM